MTLIRSLLVSTALIGVSAGRTLAADTPITRHVVYVESNDTRPNSNGILAYGIADDGSLTPIKGSPFATGGTGFMDPSFSLGPFDNDQQLVLNGRQDTLFAVNPGSNSLSAMHVSPNGRLSPMLGWPTRSGGSTPISIGRVGDRLIVLNSSEDPAQATTAGAPNAQSIDILPGGFPLRRPFEAVELPKGSDPTQALTTDTGRFIFGTGFPAGGSIAAFARNADGSITPTDNVEPPTFDGTQALALGLWAHPTRPYLYAGLVNVNRLGVYRWDDAGHLSLVTTVPDSGQGLCWLRVTPDGKWLFASNTVDDSVSVFSLSVPANPVEVSRAAGGGTGGYFEIGFSPDQRHLYALEEEDSTASEGKSNKIHVFDFDRTSGQLVSDPDKTVTLPVAATTRPFGLIVR
jgi:DNA-binding beta-propeller fold protein YncE